jgi:hypothetical protein
VWGDVAGSGAGLRGAWGLLGRCWGCRAGQVEEAVVALLHLLHHPQQEGFTVPRSLALFAGFLFPRHGGVLTGQCGFELAAQQITLQAQQVAFLLHGEQLRCFQGSRGLLRNTGAWCCIMERSRRVLLRPPVQRVAGTQQFRRIQMAVRVHT